jgi:hypothetical protein
MSNDPYNDYLMLLADDPDKNLTMESSWEDPADIDGDDFISRSSSPIDWTSNNPGQMCFHCDRILGNEMGWCSRCQKISSYGYNYTFCQASNCSERIVIKETYCANHQKECRANKCLQHISGGEDYCSSHKYQCQGSRERYYTYCSERVSSYQGYCWYHRNECQQSNCSKRIVYRDKNCYEHAPVCRNLNCSYRLTEGGNYCFQHTNKCANCSTRIADSQNYCSSCEVQQQKETEQTKLKSLVKANTTITGDIQEVERFSPSQGI